MRMLALAAYYAGIFIVASAITLAMLLSARLLFG